MRARLLYALTPLMLACSAISARADVFVLTGDGLVQGELLNKNETPREKYVIQTVQGGQITLSHEQVVEVRREAAAQSEYEKIRGNYADTVEGHWELAEWCRERLLLPSREIHLKRILELDPNHEPARRGLGYMRRQGKWITQEEIMADRGYVRYKGDWLLPEEVELLESGRKTELTEKQWIQDLRRWRGWLNGEKSAEALEHIRGIKDPHAIRALREQLKSERRHEVRKLWVECLGRIGTLSAWQTLIEVSLTDRDEELRFTAVDELKRQKSPEMTNLYVKALRTPDIAVMNRAAYALAQLEDASAVGPLIDVLVVQQKKTVREGSESIAARFPTGGGGGGISPGGLSMGATTRTYHLQIANESVRDALVKLSGVNFGFDPEKWKAWHAAKRQEQAVNLRRDE